MIICHTKFNQITTKAFLVKPHMCVFISTQGVGFLQKRNLQPRANLRPGRDTWAPMGGSRGWAPAQPKIWPKELHPLHFLYLILFITTRKIAINYVLCNHQNTPPSHLNEGDFLSTIFFVYRSNHYLKHKNSY